MAAVHTYSFADVYMALKGPGGIINLGNDAGAAEEGITIEPLEDLGTMTMGAGGDVMHSLHVGRPAKATVRLLKTSPVNALLSALVAFQAQTAANWGQNTLALSDVARGDLVTGVGVAFARHAPITWAKDGNFNEWSFNIGRVSFLLGAGD